jgi:hypothetical protein
VLVAAVALAACNDSTSGPVRDGEGRLTIQLTDAPGDLKEAFVKVERFILRGEGGRIELEPDDDGFIELLELTAGRVINVVDEAIVPIGTYSEVRVVIGDAYVVLNDGSVFATPGADLPPGIEADGELKCPSCSQSGFKMKFNQGGLVVEDNTVVLIDFDAARSFGHVAGNSGKFIMHPVLKATAETVALGSITGTVTLAQGVTLPTCGGQANTRAVFKPFAVAANDTTVGVTDTAGVFTIANLVPTTYSLGHIREIAFMNNDSLTIVAAPTPASVAVQSGAAAQASYQITAATCH